MSDHRPHSIERHCDVAVIGGSAAGVAAALQLGRQRRSVIVVDAGEPRNAPAAHMHSYLGHEGRPPSEFAEIGRTEVRRYGVEILAGRAVDTAPHPDWFRIAITDGHSIVARRVLLATGLVDVLPDIDGLAEHWGTGVIHCPFCHGYEVRDQRIVQIATHPAALHPAGLFRQLTDEFTLVLHDGVDPARPEVLALRDAGAQIIDARVGRIVADGSGTLTGLDLDDDRHLDADAVAITTRFEIRAEPIRSLGVETIPHVSGLGDVIRTEPTGETSVVGIFAAGNVVDPSHQVLQAAADGSRVAGMICLSLAAEDVATAATVRPRSPDWERRYSAESVWSGNPNGTLVHEAESLPPGRALDVGAGEGADAVWLAEQGWRVTAVDIAQRAVDRINAAARDRGVAVEAFCTDANAADGFEPGAFDLVTVHYGPTPRTSDDRGLRNLLDAVAPGGTLLVVGHDRGSVQHSVPFDPDAFVSPDDVAAAISRSPHWDLQVHERRPRSAGAATAATHPHDVVVRARRLQP